MARAGSRARDPLANQPGLVMEPNAGNAFGAVMSDAAGGVIGF